MIKPALLIAFLATIVAGCSASPEKLAETRPTTINSCLTTGTHIQHRDRACTFAPGRSYSRGDIEATGAATSAEALTSLDPTITSR